MNETIIYALCFLQVLDTSVQFCIASGEMKRTKATSDWDRFFGMLFSLVLLVVAIIL